MDLKSLKLDDLLSLDYGKLTSTELKEVERKLVKTANRRLKKLKEAKKLSFSRLTQKEKLGFKSYKPPKGYKPVSESGNLLKKEGKRKKLNLRNKRLHNVSELKDFIEKKGSQLREVNKQLKAYKQMIQDTLKTSFGSKVKITDRQAKRISRLMEKAREMGIGGEGNKKFSGSPRVLQLIVDIVKSKKISNDDAEIIIQNAITEGYESAQELLNNLNKEDEKGNNFDYDDVFGNNENL